MAKAENNFFRVAADGFYGELFHPEKDCYPGKALICFSGSDGGIELAKALAGVFQAQGLTTLALAYVLEEGLPNQFSKVPLDTLEAAAKRLHDMGYEKVGVWGISQGAELAGMSGICQGQRNFLIPLIERKSFRSVRSFGKVLESGMLPCMTSMSRWC